LLRYCHPRVGGDPFIVLQKCLKKYNLPILLEVSNIL
jgi:hypothetical protein